MHECDTLYLIISYKRFVFDSGDFRQNMVDLRFVNFVQTMFLKWVMKFFNPFTRSSKCLVFFFFNNENKALLNQTKYYITLQRGRQNPTRRTVKVTFITAKNPTERAAKQ